MRGNRVDNQTYANYHGRTQNNGAYARSQRSDDATAASSAALQLAARASSSTSSSADVLDAMDELGGTVRSMHQPQGMTAGAQAGTGDHQTVADAPTAVMSEAEDEEPGDSAPPFSPRQSVSEPGESPIGGGHRPPSTGIPLAQGPYSSRPTSPSEGAARLQMQRPVAVSAASHHPSTASHHPPAKASFAAVTSIDGVAHRLQEFLGPGVVPLMLQSRPPALIHDSVTGAVPPEAGGSRTASGAVRISAPATVTSNDGRGSNRPAHGYPVQYNDARGLGGQVRVDDDLFQAALLTLPLCMVLGSPTDTSLPAGGSSLARMALARAVLALDHGESIQSHEPVAATGAGAASRGTQGGGTGEPQGGTRRLQEPSDTPLPALPKIPRAQFGDYFGTSSTHTQPGSGRGVGRGPAVSRTTLDGMPWPCASWPRYHASQAALLLEEGRGMLASGAVEVAQLRLSGRLGSTGHGQGQGGQGGQGRGGLLREGDGERRQDSHVITPVWVKEVQTARPLDIPLTGGQSDATLTRFQQSYTRLHITVKVPAATTDYRQGGHKKGRGGQGSVFEGDPLRALGVRDMVLLRPTWVPLQSCLACTDRALPGKPEDMRPLLGIVRAKPSASSSTAGGRSRQGAEDDGNAAAGVSRSGTEVVITVMVPTRLVNQFPAPSDSTRRQWTDAEQQGGMISSSSTSAPPSRLGDDMGNMAARSWQLVQLCGMSTLLHSYTSMASVIYSPFGGVVLSPHLARSNAMYSALASSTMVGVNAPAAETASAGGGGGGRAPDVPGGASADKEDSIPPQPNGIPEALYKALCRRFDASQLRVIFVAACGGAFRVPIVQAMGVNGNVQAVDNIRAFAEVTCVIGPPGTGKTRTVLGILSALRATLGGVHTVTVSAQAQAPTRAAALHAVPAVADLSVAVPKAQPSVLVAVPTASHSAPAAPGVTAGKIGTAVQLQSAATPALHLPTPATAHKTASSFALGVVSAAPPTDAVVSGPKTQPLTAYSELSSAVAAAAAAVITPAQPASLSLSAFFSSKLKASTSGTTEQTPAQLSSLAPLSGTSSPSTSAPAEISHHAGQGTAGKSHYDAGAEPQAARPPPTSPPQSTAGGAMVTGDYDDIEYVSDDDEDRDSDVVIIEDEDTNAAGDGQQRTVAHGEGQASTDDDDDDAIQSDATQSVNHRDQSAQSTAAPNVPSPRKRQRQSQLEDNPRKAARGSKNTSAADGGSISDSDEFDDGEDEMPPSTIAPHSSAATHTLPVSDLRGHRHATTTTTTTRAGAHVSAVQAASDLMDMKPSASTADAEAVDSDDHSAEESSQSGGDSASSSSSSDGDEPSQDLTELGSQDDALGLGIASTLSNPDLEALRAKQARPVGLSSSVLMSRGASVLGKSTQAAKPAPRAAPIPISALLPLSTAVSKVSSVPTIRRVKFLITTPSNAACDEIVARLLDLPPEYSEADTAAAAGAGRAGGTSLGGSGTGAGASSSGGGWHARHPGGLIDPEGRTFIPTVVRTGSGSDKSTRPEVLRASLERHVQRRMASLILAGDVGDGTRTGPGTGTGTGTGASTAQAQGGFRGNNMGAGASAHGSVGTNRFQREIDELRRIESQLANELGQLNARLGPTAGQAHAGSRPSGIARTPAAGSTLALLSQAGVPALKSPHKAGLPGTAAPVAADPSLVTRRKHVERDLKDTRDAMKALLSTTGQRMTPETAEQLRIRAVVEVLEGADVIATTLSGSVQLPSVLIRCDPGHLTCLTIGGSHAAKAATVRGMPASLALAIALRFDAMVVDEAGQSIEPEVLAPLRLSYMGHIGGAGAAKGLSPAVQPFSGPDCACRRLVLVGDPLQLPATVISRSASEAGLNVSLFERLSGAGLTPLLLRRQYRMHSDISAFASRHFYKGLVKDADSIRARQGGHVRAASSSLASAGSMEQGQVAEAEDSCKAPVTLLDIPWGVESRGSSGSTRSSNESSYGNDGEVLACVALVKHLLAIEGAQAGTMAAKTSSPAKSSAAFTARGSGKPSIGVITMYNEQKGRILQGLRQALGEEVAKTIRVSSVDAFQGQEMDTVIISCVRSQPVRSDHKHGGGGIGFLSDARRLNVAVTRAKYSLVLLCNAQYLAASDPHWEALVQHAKTEGKAATLPAPRRFAHLGQASAAFGRPCTKLGKALQEIDSLLTRSR